MTVAELINETSEKTAAAIVEKLQKSGTLKDCKLSSFTKTERVLYEYPHWKGTDITETAKFCELVEKALDSISDDPYYQIIELKYFQKWTHERIAEYFDVEVSVISKRRTKLINALRPIIFSEDYIKELKEL